MVVRSLRANKGKDGRAEFKSMGCVYVIVTLLWKDPDLKKKKTELIPGLNLPYVSTLQAAEGGVMV